MNPQVTTLVWIHYIAAFVLGLPALIGSVYTGYGLVELLRNPIPPLREVQSSQDGMLQIITGAERGIGMVLRPLAAFGEFFIKVAFAVSIVVLLFAVILFFTGRGLNAGAGWARALSGLALGGMALVGAFGCLISGGPGIRLLASSMALGGGYGVYLLATAFKLK